LLGSAHGTVSPAAAAAASSPVYCSDTARCVMGSEKPKKSGPEMRVLEPLARHMAVHGWVGDVPVNTSPVDVSRICRTRQRDSLSKGPATPTRPHPTVTGGGECAVESGADGWCRCSGVGGGGRWAGALWPSWSELVVWSC
jgi:hypothetical protein